LRELTAADVRSALIKLAATRATRTVSMTHAALVRAIRHAEASDKVRRNVALSVDSPSDRRGRPSRSLTFEQAVALITTAQDYALYAYVVLSLLVGIRTEEAWALRWITFTWTLTQALAEAGKRLRVCRWRIGDMDCQPRVLARGSSTRADTARHGEIRGPGPD